MKVFAASSVVPMASHKKAVQLIQAGLVDDVFGKLSPEKIQICPQHAGYLNDDLIDEFVETYPNTEFRLHASPKIKGQESKIFYVSNANDNMDYFKKADQINQTFKSSGYSIHAGERADATIDQMIDRLQMIQDNSETTVAVEGLYPSKSNRWLMSSWEEYERVAERGCLYALDLSHLNIVAKHHGRNDALVEALIKSSQCIEIHVSENDGRSDSHKTMETLNPPWWMQILMNSKSKADIFYEGILVDPRKR